MRKATFRTQAELVNNQFFIYKSLQYRWEDDCADPKTDDVEYHLTLEEAISASEKINLDLGFEAQVDKLTISYHDFNEIIEFGQDFELSELDHLANDCETVHHGETNDGEVFEGDEIAVFYKHHRYMNYAYDILNVDFVKYTSIKKQSDLVNESDSTSSTYVTVFKNLDELADDFRMGQSSIFEKIHSGSKHVREFLKQNEHPDFIEDEETED